MQLWRKLALLGVACGAAAAQDSPAPPAATTPTPTTTAPTAATPTPTTAATSASGTGISTLPAAAGISVDGDFKVVRLADGVDSVRLDVASGRVAVASDAAKAVEDDVAKQMRVLMGTGTTKVMLQTLSSDVITRLEISSYQDTRQAKISFPNSGLSNLSSLTSLTFSKILFVKSTVSLVVPITLSYLKIDNTNVADVAVSGSSQLKELDFENTNFGSLPYVLYQRKYTDSLAISSNLNISSNITQLSAEEFANAQHNLGDAGASLVSFQSSCENVSSSTRHIVCSDSEREGVRDFGSSNFVENPATPTPTTTSRKSSSNTTLTVIVIVIAVIAAVLAYFVARRYFCTSASSSRSPRNNERTVGLISKEDPQAQNKLSFISSDDALRPIRLEQQDITINKSLGTGRLWVGDFAGRKVIVKRIEAESSDSYATKGLITQARALATVAHPNIVSLIGVTWVQGTDFGVVAEFMEKGTLRSVLSDLDSELDLQSKLHMCLDIAQGLMYLHNSERNMYMKRLTSRKVLVNGAIECKLNLYECHPCTNRIEYPEVFGAGEMAWEAPELITRTGVLDPRKMNIFSLGVLIGEIMTRVSPYQSAVDAVGHTLADLELSKRIRRQERLMPHENRREFTELPPVLRDMVERCFSYQPLLRPTAEEVVHCLESVKDYSERVGSTTSL